MMNAHTVSNIPREMLSSWPLALGRLPIMALHFMPDSFWPEVNDRNPILLIPGLLAPPWTMALIEVGLRRAGYTVYLADMSRNTGNFELQGPALLAQIEKISNQHRLPVDLIGWSMGGRYSLRIAEAVSNKIGKIVTLGSPIVNGSISPLLEEIWRTALLLAGIQPEQVREEMETAIYLPKKQNPLSSVVGSFDAVVAPESSVIPKSMTRKNSRRENIWVPKGHIGMGLSLAVLAIALDRIAERRATWTRYSPS